MQRKIGLKHLTPSNDFQNDVNELAEWVDRGVNIEDKTIEMSALKHRIEQGIMKTLGGSDSISVIYATYEIWKYGYVFVIVNDDNAETVMTMSEILADFGKFLKNGWNIIPWQRVGLTYKIISSFEYSI